MDYERIGASPLGDGDIVHAPCVRAGRWVFGTGLRATGPDGLMDPAVLRPGRPLGWPPVAQREAEAVFSRMGALLQTAGSSLQHVARLDQYYPDPRHVDPYHVARKKALSGRVAPSTSVIVPGLLNRDAAMDVQVLACTTASGWAAEQAGQERLSVPQTSGYAPCLRVGDLVFVAGQLARDASGALAAQAQVPPGQLWNGTRIQLETDYLLRERLLPGLAAAGSAPELVLKAQVYLSHGEDLAAFWAVWSRAFGGRVPPTTVVPVPHPAFGTRDATIEVNLVAAHASAGSRVRDVACDVELFARDMVPARVFDELLFVAGLMAVEDGGLCVAAQVPDTAPYLHDTVGVQMRHIQAQARRIFEAAGSALPWVTRALHFLGDLNDAHRAVSAWSADVRGPGLPFSAIQVAPELFVPGARVIVDLWGYVPGAEAG